MQCEKCKVEAVVMVGRWVYVEVRHIGVLDLRLCDACHRAFVLAQYSWPELLECMTRGKLLSRPGSTRDAVDATMDVNMYLTAEHALANRVLAWLKE